MSRRLRSTVRLAWALSLAACTSSRPELDLVLAGGTVVDGTGAPGQRADVGVRDGRITAIGDLASASARERLDVTGLVVAPGFIDPHTHARERLLTIPTADNLVRQGITTVVDGNDGSSPLPLAPYLDSLATARPALNVGLFVGHGSIRRAVLGTDNREASAAELARMDSLTGAAMRDGALGLSSGLFYVPGSYAPTSELVALARTARAHGGTTPHTCATRTTVCAPRWTRRSASPGNRGSRCTSRITRSVVAATTVAPSRRWR